MPSAVDRGGRGAAKGFLVAVDDLHKLDAQLPSALPQLIVAVGSRTVGSDSGPRTTRMRGSGGSGSREKTRSASGPPRPVRRVRARTMAAEVAYTALPERVHRVVRLLPAEISSRCRLFIQLAALGGKEFELGAVAEPFGQPAGTQLPLVEEATDVGVIAGVGDRLVFTQPLFRQAVLESLPEPMRAGARGESVRPGTSVRPGEPARFAAGALAGRPWTAGPGGDRPGDRHPGQRRPRQQPDRHPRQPLAAHGQLSPSKMFGTLSVRSRSELAGTVRQRLWEAP
ncbi:hypothetical protein ACIOHS_41250 [Streptomyces sp. NPDC088253]|uniref:hypothetical protein n=1 Tax=Streptomyces sp. NPDC088253 TaxID=3365846 RepID=UPI00382B093B